MSALPLLQHAFEPRLRLHVAVSSPAMLGLLWRLQLSKGSMSLERSHAVALHTRVELALVVAAATEITLAATVRSCTPQGACYLVTVGLDEIAEAQRTAIGKIVGP
jgi:hypothetical protein